MFKRALKAFFLFLCPLFLFGVEALYLTYPDNPSHSVAVHWIEKEKDTGSQQVLYRSVTDTDWIAVESKKSSLNKKYTLNAAVILNLQEDTQYVFRLVNDQAEYLFKTLRENLDSPIHIAIGGDAYQKAAPYKETNLQVASKSPDFVILGGDIAYANQGDAIDRWVEFFRIWFQTMKTPKNNLIPIIATTGNHDILSKKEGGGKLFMQFFPYLDEGSYGVLEINKKTCFFLLDTGHINSIEGRQTQWLAKILEEKKNFAYKIAVYHIAAYPSIYSYEKETPTLIRKFWCPLFELYDVPLAFENHNHAFKRTCPIRKEKRDPTGVVYIGDGSWSADIRRKSDSRWYLEKRIITNAFSFVTLSEKEILVESFSSRGALIDSWKKL